MAEITFTADGVLLNGQPITEPGWVIELPHNTALLAEDDGRILIGDERVWLYRYDPPGLLWWDRRHLVQITRIDNEGMRTLLS